MTEASQLTVFYNGACPFCAREIAFYRSRSEAGGLSWVDVNRLARDEGLLVRSRTEAGVCIHLLYADGTLVSGGEALAGVWAALPGFRLWGRFFRAVTSTPSHDLPPGQVKDRGIVMVEDGSAESTERRKFPFRGIIRFPGAFYSRSH